MHTPTARVLLLLAFMLAGCTNALANTPGAAPAPQDPEPVIALRYLSHILGVSFWTPGEAEPDYWINAKRLFANPVLLQKVLAHERNHVAVMKQFGTRERWMRWHADNGPLFEAMGFCASAEASRDMGYDFHEAVRVEAGSLSGADSYRRYGLTREAAQQLIYAACQDPLYLAAKGGAP